MNHHKSALNYYSFFKFSHYIQSTVQYHMKDSTHLKINVVELCFDTSSNNCIL
jgi:hypothetical protein